MVHSNLVKFFASCFGKPVVKYCYVLLLMGLFFPSAYLSAQTTSSIKANCIIPSKGINTVFIKATFSKVSGKIAFDPENLWGSFLDITLDASSLSGITEKNDAMLKSQGYFNALAYPEIKFTSTGIYCDSATKSTIYHVDGSLHVKNITQPVTIDFHVHHSSGFTVLVGKIKLDSKTWHLKTQSGTSEDAIINIEATIR